MSYTCQLDETISAMANGYALKIAASNYPPIA